ncbi:uncharacterized protein [Physcomitrium patens]|uniref:uncharacterized protein n=1 Tax=Physcomitrium patens TaxID=3218 RepID=UPI003CCE4F12
MKLVTANGIVTAEYLIVGTQMAHHGLYEEHGTDYGYANDSVIQTQRFHQEALSPPDAEHPIIENMVHYETQELDQAVHQNFASEYQLVFLESEDKGKRSDHAYDRFPTEAVTELGSGLVLDSLLSNVAGAPPSPPAQSELSRRKRARKSTSVGHNGVALRYDGAEERFTAYYRPSYWTEDDSAVFLGEYPTFDEAQDAHNLLALMHEGQNALIGLTASTVDRYAVELQRWEGKHHVDLVCALRLRQV